MWGNLEGIAMFLLVLCVRQSLQPIFAMVPFDSSCIVYHKYACMECAVRMFFVARVLLWVTSEPGCITNRKQRPCGLALRAFWRFRGVIFSLACAARARSALHNHSREVSDVGLLVRCPTTGTHVGRVERNIRRLCGAIYKDIAIFCLFQGCAPKTAICSHCGTF